MRMPLSGPPRMRCAPGLDGRNRRSQRLKPCPCVADDNRPSRCRATPSWSACACRCRVPYAHTRHGSACRRRSVYCQSLRAVHAPGSARRSPKSVATLPPLSTSYSNKISTMDLTLYLNLTLNLNLLHTLNLTLTLTLTLNLTPTRTLSRTENLISTQILTLYFCKCVFYEYMQTCLLQNVYRFVLEH